MGYFNYHAKAKQLIREGHLLKCEYYKQWNKIKNCYVLFFDNHIPMPIREEKFFMYYDLIENVYSET